MTKKHIIHKLIVDEISGVDRPAQKTFVAIMKAEQTTMTMTNDEAISEIDKLMQEPQKFTKAEVGDYIDALVERLARDNQTTFEKSYVALLASPIGGSLYRLYKGASGQPALVQAKPYGSGKAPLTQEGRQAIADALEATAKAKAKLSGKSAAHEYTNLLNSADGQKLYAAYTGHAAP